MLDFIPPTLIKYLFHRPLPPARDHYWSITGIVAQHPGIGQRAVEAEEVGQPPAVTAPHDDFRNGVAALADAGRHALHGQLRGSQPCGDYVQLIAVLLET